MRSSSSSNRQWLARLVTGALLALGAAGCVAGATPSVTTPSADTATPATPAAVASPGPTSPATPTQAAEASPETPIPTTRTDWGVILDAVPSAFPRYPTATTTEPPPEPVSAALETDASVDEAATWYRDALASAGFSSIDLANALEDGTRVLDAATDASACRVQLTFRPLGGSTMIIVLYGAGCVAGTGG